MNWIRRDIPYALFVVGVTIVTGCAEKPKLQLAPFVAKPESPPACVRSWDELVALKGEYGSEKFSQEWSELTSTVDHLQPELFQDERWLPGTPLYEFLRSGLDVSTTLDRNLLVAYQQSNFSCDTDDASAALRHLNAGTLAFETGLLLKAQAHFRRAVYWMEEVTDEALEQQAMRGRSDVKIYKGDSFEKTMAHFYLGLIAYQLQDYEEAKREFRRALMAHSTRPAEESRERFALLHYWLGKSYDKLGEKGNVRVAMLKARETVPSKPVLALMEPESFKNGNLTVMIQIGAGASVVPVGSDWQRTKYVPTEYSERSCDIYVDGKLTGRAVLLADLWAQISTQGQTEEQELQEAKAVAKAVVQNLPYINILGVAWDVTGDMRSWSLLPDRILIWSGKVTPGDHAVTVRFYDEEDYELTRYRQSWHFVHVGEQDERLLIVRSGRGKCDMAGKEI